MKTDARVRYTKKVIRETFFYLLKEKPINKITVSSICDKAEINRATFYRYYSDPYDLMRSIEDTLIASLKTMVTDTDNKNITETILSVLRAMQQHTPEYEILFSENADPYFFDRLVHESYSIKENALEKMFPGVSPVYNQWLYLFMTHGFTSILKSWAVNGMKEDVEGVAAFINKLNNIVLKGLL